MSASLYDECVPVMTRFLTNLKTILAKAAAHAAANKIDEAALITARLYPDMFAFARQVQIACDNAKGAVGRLAGVDIPKHADTEATFADLTARIDKTLAYIAGVPASAFEGRGDAQIVLAFGDWRQEFTASGYLRTWALPNFYFHVTTAYDILRHNGVPVGKMDYLG